MKNNFLKIKISLIYILTRKLFEKQLQLYFQISYKIIKKINLIFF